MAVTYPFHIFPLQCCAGSALIWSRVIVSGSVSLKLSQLGAVAKLRSRLRSILTPRAEPVRQIFGRCSLSSSASADSLGECRGE
jgi:hypothetical protein